MIIEKHILIHPEIDGRIGVIRLNKSDYRVVFMIGDDDDSITNEYGKHESYERALIHAERIAKVLIRWRGDKPLKCMG